MALSNEEIFRRLYLIRRVEEEIIRVYPSDKIQSPIHLSIGQELASVAVCAALRPTDRVFGSYRSHALYLAKGGDLKAFIAELYGKATGCARGKGGSMHMVEPDAGLLGTSAIVGSLIPVAVGYAFAQKKLGTGVITACFFGDGAAEEGAFFESLNFAVLHQVPVLFVCENNGYAIHTPLLDRQSTSIWARARAFGMTAADPFTFDQTLDLARVFADRVRDGHGPVLLEMKATREKEHVGIGDDWSQGYRTRRSDGSAPLSLDPVNLAISGVPGMPGIPPIDPVSVVKIKAGVEREIEEAFQFAEMSPPPGPEELMEHLYG